VSPLWIVVQIVGPPLIPTPTDPLARPTDSVTSFEHLLRLTDEHRLFEHADGTTPRYHGAYARPTTGDVAYAVVTNPALLSDLLLP
jgi:hypothetical protein